jgi:hypothetical protein
LKEKIQVLAASRSPSRLLTPERAAVLELIARIGAEFGISILVASHLLDSEGGTILLSRHECRSVRRRYRTKHPGAPVRRTGRPGLERHFGPDSPHLVGT